MTDKPEFDRNKYNNEYKKEKFDFFGIYTPKGTKETVQKIANSKGLKMSEYIRNALMDAIEKDTQ